MRNWLRWTVVIVFTASILYSTLASMGQRVDVKLLFPWLTLTAWPLGGVLFVFASYGAGGAVLLALLDRARLAKANKDLRRDHARLESELKSLRHVAAGEPQKK